MIESPVSAVPVVDLTEVTSARAVAVLSVPPYSRVLDIGPGHASAARALAARGCRVWAIDTDGSAIEPLAPWCEGTFSANIAQVDVATLLGGQRVDAILLLSGLEHPSDPAGALAGVMPFLDAGGRILLAVPLSDRHRLEGVFSRAGVRVIDEARVGSAAEAAQLLLVAVPGDGLASEGLPGLTGTLTHHLHRVADRCRFLEERSRDLADQVEIYRCERDRLREALEEAREWHQRSAGTVAETKEALQRSEYERQRLEQQMADTAAELARCQRERRFFRDDVMVKDAYLAALREEAAIQQEKLQQHEALYREQAQLRQRLDEELREINARLETTSAEHAAERQRAGELAQCNQQLREQLTSAAQELHRVHTAIAGTVAQPRYLVADRLNHWLKGLTFVHAPLKRAWLARSVRKR